MTWNTNRGKKNAASSSVLENDTVNNHYNYLVLSSNYPWPVSIVASHVAYQYNHLYLSQYISYGVAKVGG